VSTTHISYLIRDAWRYRGLVLGAPTYDVGLYPPMSFFIEMLARKKLQRRLLGLFGTYGWSGGGVKTLRSFADDGDWDWVEPVVEARCHAAPTDLENCRLLGQRLAQRLRE
jgi:flavorubredoxin